MRDFKYLPYDVEYAVHSDHIPQEILPFGVCWSYVSSTFLNGIVNYGDLLAAALIHRYRGMDGDAEDAERQPQMIGRTPCRTKRQVLAAFEAGERTFHTELSVFMDDVFLLTRVGEEQYAFFWYDCDVSDCCVGRFRTQDTVDEIVSEFRRYADDRSSELSVTYGHFKEPTPSTPLPKEWLQGWLSF